MINGIHADKKICLTCDKCKPRISKKCPGATFYYCHLNREKKLVISERPNNNINNKIVPNGCPYHLEYLMLYDMEVKKNDKKRTD